jgi:hypothetical protein
MKRNDDGRVVVVDTGVFLRLVHLAQHGASECGEEDVVKKHVKHAIKFNPHLAAFDERRIERIAARNEYLKQKKRALELGRKAGTHCFIRLPINMTAGFAYQQLCQTRMMQGFIIRAAKRDGQWMLHCRAGTAKDFFYPDAVYLELPLGFTALELEDK